MKMKTYNVDTDILIYKAAISAEKATDWNNGTWTLEADMEAGVRNLDAQVEDIKKAVGFSKGDIFQHYLSDPDRSRLVRKKLLPSYKNNRTSSRRPMLLSPLWDYVDTELGGRWLEGREGDDLLGMNQTADSVCVSVDKDMLTIPGYHYNILKPEQGVILQSLKAADSFFYQQALAGDPVDGYSGCPGIGMKTAASILGDEPHIILRATYHLKSGKNKGELKETWYKEYHDDYTPWDTIASYYRKAGLTNEDALTQGRMARIVRAEDTQGLDNSEIELWQPMKMKVWKRNVIKR
jgi:DNA polymerase-1